MTDLFISYSRKDQGFVRRLHQKLEEGGRDIWVDWENIPLTAEWLQEIYDGIEAANAFGYVISPDSVRSEVCNLELAHAILHNKRLVPILYRELVEDMDKKALHHNISAHNWIFFRETDDFQKSFQSLIEALDTDLDHLRLHTRLLVRAVQWNDKERDVSLVLRGNELREAVHWLDRSGDKQPEPTELHREYIIASQRAASARRRVVILTSVYGLVVLILAVFAFWQAVNAEQRRLEAEEQRNIAQENASTAVAAESTAVFNGEQAQSLALASNAQQVLYRDGNPELALALALVASNMPDAPQLAENTLAQTAYYPSTRKIIEGMFYDNVSQIALDKVRNRILAVSGENDVVLLDIATYAEVHRWTGLTGDTGLIHALAITADSQYGAVARADGTVLIYNLETFATVKSFAQAESQQIWRMVFTPDMQSLIAVAQNSDIFVWDWQNAELRYTITEPEVALDSVAVRADSQQAIAGDENGVVWVWNVADGEITKQFNPVGESSVWSLAYVDENQILVGTEDFKMRLINLTTNEEVLLFSGHSSRIWDIVVAPDRKTVFTGGFDSTVIQWDLETGQILGRFRGHQSTVYGIVLANDRQFVTGSSDGTLRVWDFVNGAEINRYVDYSNWIQNITLYYSNGREYLLTASFDGQVLAYDTATKQQTLKIEVPEMQFTSLALSPDQTRVVTGAWTDGAVILWDMTTGTRISQFQKDNTQRIRSVAYSPDGKLVAAVGDANIPEIGEGNVIFIWDVATGTLLHTIPTGYDRLWSVHFSSDSKQVLVSSANGLAGLWNIADQKLVLQLEGHTGATYIAIFSPDNKTILTASQDRSIRLWNATNGQFIRRYDGHLADVNSVEFSADGKTFVSGSDDRTVRLWDINGTEIKRFDGHVDEIQSVAFAADGKSVYSGSKDATVRQWQVLSLTELQQWAQNNREIPTLTCEQRTLYRVEPLCLDS